jgi:predicted esterase
VSAPDPRLCTVRFEARAHYRLDAPSDAPAAPAPVVLALHGYGQPPDEMAAYARSVAPAHAVVLAPEGPLSFYREPRHAGGAQAGGVGYGWIADPRRDEADERNSHLLDAVLADAAATTPLDLGRLAVLGYSQGVGVAAHWLLTRPGRAAAWIALAGGVRPALRPILPALAGLRTLWITGRHDRSYPPAYAADLLRALGAGGLRLEHLDLDCGHGLLDPAREAVRGFLDAPLAPGAGAP